MSDPPVSPASDPDGDPVRYVDDPRALVAGNAVRLLRNGAEAFPAWLEAIERSRRRVSMEMYIFNDDGIGGKFAAALSRAARRGVAVRLLYDFVGCRETPPSFFAKLRRDGVHPIVYHAYHFWRPRFWTLWRRDHRKTLVCDGEIAFAGGLNISDAWMPSAAGGGDWRDAAVEVRGPAVRAIEAAFLQTWNRRARRQFRVEPDSLGHPPHAGGARLAVISNSELRDRFAIRRSALYAIRQSRRRIYLANPYFIPDRGILKALAQAARRGVDVRILVPARSDVRIVDFAGRATFGMLLGSGVRIWQHDLVVHTKGLLVDDAFVSIGSYNLDRRSLVYNLEMVLNVLDRAVAADLGRALAEDMAGAVELGRLDFRARPLVHRLFEWIAYKLRHWL